MWQKSLPSDLLRYDNLNIYELSPFTDAHTIEANDWFSQYIGDEKIIHGFGVRDLFEKLCECLSKKCRTIAIPNDVYPVYFTIAERYFDKIETYPTYPFLNLDAINEKDIVFLILNPLVPKGFYLKEKDIQDINDKAYRYVIVDACYNYDIKTIGSLFHTPHVYEIFSLSKLFLMNKAKGWIVSKDDIKITSKSNPCVLNNSNLNTYLKDSFRKNWLSFNLPYWDKPDIGYLSIVNINHIELLNRFNIVSIPASVFGSNHQDLSVISNISQVKLIL